MVINDFRSNKTQKEKDEIIILIDAGLSKQFKKLVFDRFSNEF